MEGTLAVVSQSGQSLSFFDLSSGERTAHLSGLIAEPHELALDRKRNLLYLSHTYRYGHFWAHGDYSSEISVIDCDTKTCTDVIKIFPALGPHGLAIDEQRDILYASIEELEAGKGGGLVGIDLTKRTVTKKIESESKPHWFAMTPDGRKAYTCNKTQPFVSIVDLLEETFIGKIEVKSCEEPGMSMDGKFVYFPTPGLSVGPPPEDASIKVIDTALDRIIESVSMELGAQVVRATSPKTMMVAKHRFGPDGHGTATKAQPGRLTLYSTDTYKSLGEVEIELGPLTVRATPDGKTAFVANIFSGTVTIVDLASMTVVRTLEVGTTLDPKKANHLGAHGMAYF